MLALEPVIADRVREALTPLAATWSVFGYSTSTGDRSSFPLASVMFDAANVADSRSGAVNIAPGWRVTLVTRKSIQASATVDAAFAAVVSALHNWAPGTVSARPWNRLALVAVMAPQYPDDGLVGIEMVFNTHARFDGQP
ncbi:MAG: hypothetical protein AB7E55_19780 [Pigmentiphaga sp.]